ncbi:hypothetical protein [Roseiterribacter gracilis]
MNELFPRYAVSALAGSRRRARPMPSVRRIREDELRIRLIRIF